MLTLDVEGRSRRGFAPAALVLLAAGLTWGTDPAAADEPSAAEVRALLQAGDARGALERAALLVEYSPDAPEALALAADSAATAGDRDAALWYARRALQVSDGAAAKTAAARVAELDPLAPEVRAAYDDACAALLDVGRLAARRKLWANAVELLVRLEDSDLGAPAAKELAAVYAKKQAVLELLDDGLDVPLARESRRPAEWIARNDAKHATWETAWEVKSDNYTVVTDTGWELANAIATSMEQMNLYYRKVFRHKERGGGTARCTIYVFRSRDEYLAHVPADEHDAAGFFTPGKNTIHLYDTRPSGEPIAEMWRTLFHEASHQFTDMIMAEVAPAWLDEGTASYFEGAELHPNGRVQTNLVVDAYLRALHGSLQSGKPSLRDVISFAEDGSYAADYYPVGWGLVYFLRNYEDDACERVYAPLYDRYVDSYRTGGKHDRFERFVETFVTKAKLPGVARFEEFEEHFRAWAEGLYRVWTAGPEVASELVERARRQHAAGQAEAAIATYRFALQKRPSDLAATAELAGIYAELGRRDAALALDRRVVELARSGDPERAVPTCDDVTAGSLAQAAQERMAKADALFTERWTAACAAIEAGARAAATAYDAAGAPRNADVVLRDAARLLALPASLVKARDEHVAAHAVDGRHRCRLPLAPGLDSWELIGGWRADGSVLRADTVAETALAIYREELPDSYRFEVTATSRTKDEGRWMALAFGLGEDGVWDTLGVYGNATASVERVRESFELLLRLPDLPVGGADEVRLAVEVTQGHAAFHVNGTCVAALDMGETALAGRVGVACAQGVFEFRDPVLIRR